MPDLPDARDVLSLVGGEGLMCRTGVLLYTDQASDSGALGTTVELVDFVAWKLPRFGGGRSRLRLTAEDLLADLDMLCDGVGSTSVSPVLVGNLDVALAYLSHAERDYFWAFVESSFRRRRRALIIELPEGARLVGPREPQRWAEAGRLGKIT